MYTRVALHVIQMGAQMELGVYDSLSFKSDLLIFAHAAFRLCSPFIPLGFFKRQKLFRPGLRLTGRTCAYLVPEIGKYAECHTARIRGVPDKNFG
jgi:hypothetical protein